MTTSVSLVNIPTGSPTDTAVKFLDQTKLIRRTGTSSSDGSVITSEYVYADGDPTTETTVSARVQYDNTNNVIRNSIRLRTVQVVTTDSVVVETAPIEVLISWNIPGVAQDPAKVLDMIGTAYSLTFDGVTTKVPNGNIVAAMNRGLIQDLY